MDFKFKYGKDYVKFSIDEANVLEVINPKDSKALVDPAKAVREAVANPISSPRIKDIVFAKKPSTIAIVVNDTTRPTPYEYILPPVLEELHEAGVLAEQITFIIATGIHRGHTDEENRRIFGTEVVDKYNFLNHDCDGELANLGPLQDGEDLVINKVVADADMVITTGLIGLHYFAGYSGGRKSILPGVAGRHLITHNHSKMTDPRATSGSYQENPVHWIMLEAARKAGVDFIVNVVTDEQKQLIKVVAGDVEKAWLEGVKICEEMNIVGLDAKADVVIASAGGFPKDINIYQAQKALENAEQATRDGGTIILVAECQEGFGEDIFEEWCKSAKSLQDIFDRFDREFVLGGHKAYVIAQVIAKKEVILISVMSKEDTEAMFMTPQKDIQTALDYVKEKHGKDFKAIIMPQGGMVLPKSSN